MRRHDAENDNLTYSRDTHDDNSDVGAILRPNRIDRIQMNDYLSNVPIPPVAATFSYQQRYQQQIFFQRFLSLPRYELPYSSIDLYQYSMIAVCKYLSSR